MMPSVVVDCCCSPIVVVDCRCSSSVVVDCCNPSAQEAETGRSLWLNPPASPDYIEPQAYKTLSQKTKVVST